MQINFSGTVIPVNAELEVWGKQVKAIEALVKNADDADEIFWEKKFVPELETAVRLLGSDSKAITELAVKGTNESKAEVRALLCLRINFSAESVFYDYFFDVGDVLGGFCVHIKAFPDGRFEYCGIS